MFALRYFRYVSHNFIKKTFRLRPSHHFVTPHIRNFNDNLILKNVLNGIFSSKQGLSTCNSLKILVGGLFSFIGGAENGKN